ncbi:MAG: hypothetical protein LUC93_08240 [Planctomycetaceae bacterium]|nr:hypothetical protein [Planctomycetaceae bacterium]
MQKIQTHFGQPCYAFGNEKVDLYSTVLAGNTNPYFRLGSRHVSPFFIPSWWNEGWLENAPPLFNVCRGNFFCLPLGGDLEGTRGKVIPIHGRCANEHWNWAGIEESGESRSLFLEFEDELGLIRKELRLLDGHSVVYENNAVSGWEGDYPVGYHPTVKLPDLPGSAHFAISRVIDGYTTFENHESAERGGYSLFLNAQKITDMTKIRTIFGDTVDFTSQPIRQGYEDVFMTINDPADELAYIAITFRDEGYVYFQLKNPRILGNTMFWVSNGGRHYAPWNGRCRPVLGMEETFSYYHYGIPASTDDNPIKSLGHKTAVRLTADRTYDFPLIYGVAVVPNGFLGVKTIRAEGSGIVLTGLDGQEVHAAVDLSFLLREHEA